MEFRPRYAQPFTLAEAMELDVSVITDEIARLDNSLKHLQETQDMLREYQSTETPERIDPEIQKALDENKIVIGSQTERISMLKMVLAEQGVVGSNHYEVGTSLTAATTVRDVPLVGNSSQRPSTSQVHEHDREEGEGVEL